MNTIINLSNTEAKEYFLKQENYCNIDLPKYINFEELLTALSQNEYIEKIKLCEAKKHDEVNYRFLTNKDGKFAWRPLQLINPAIYVNLVNKITTIENWKLIKNRFKDFQKNNNIECCSIPVALTGKSKSILNWWQGIEQQSLEFALEFDFFMNTDITDCYSSIYTHSISWALHDKKTIKENLKNPNNQREKFLGDDIDKAIQAMQYGQTNGIPQGSVLMDFIAEMVLGYADTILSEKIEQYSLKNYKILRYRDDYRIFSTNQETLVRIAKLLTETLIELNLKLNSQKTFISNNIVRDVIKPDKLYWNESKQKEKSLQKHLFLIHSLAEKYPNSGSLSTALTIFLEKKLYPLKILKKENSKVLVSILIDIAFKNPRTYPIITAILSKILSLESNDECRTQIMIAIEKKFDKIPNVGHLQVWLQRLTIKTERNKQYTETLCKKVINNNEKIWNTDWIEESTIKNIFNNKSIIKMNEIKEMEQIINPNEVTIFDY